MAGRKTRQTGRSPTGTGNGRAGLPEAGPLDLGDGYELAKVTEEQLEEEETKGRRGFHKSPAAAESEGLTAGFGVC